MLPLDDIALLRQAMAAAAALYPEATLHCRFDGDEAFVEVSGLAPETQLKESMHGVPLLRAQEDDSARPAATLVE